MFSTHGSESDKTQVILWSISLCVYKYLPIGEMTLDLCHLPKPAKSISGVSPAQVPQMMGNGTSNSVAISFLDDHSTSINLFEAKRVYGYFPFTTVEDGITTIAVS